MKPTLRERIIHIRQAIDDVRDLLKSTSFDDFLVDRHTRAATERYFEIMSEASRHIPQAIQARYPQVPWKDIAGIGNVIRHDYHDVAPEIIYDSYRQDLGALSDAINAMIAEL